MKFTDKIWTPEQNFDDISCLFFCLSSWPFSAALMQKDPISKQSKFLVFAPDIANTPVNITSWKYYVHGPISARKTYTFLIQKIKKKKVSMNSAQISTKKYKKYDCSCYNWHSTLKVTPQRWFNWYQQYLQMHLATCWF